MNLSIGTPINSRRETRNKQIENYGVERLSSIKFLVTIWLPVMILWFFAETLKNKDILNLQFSRDIKPVITLFQRISTLFMRKFRYILRQAQNMMKIMVQNSICKVFGKNFYVKWETPINKDVIKGHTFNICWSSSDHIISWQAMR